MSEVKKNSPQEVILAVLRLSRAMKRCPPDHGERPFPPAVGRMMDCVRMHPGVSSRELCELLDLRPSSLSEMLARAEKEGWITRVADEEDRRMQHVSLSAKGQQLVEGIEVSRELDAARKIACFSDAERETFIQLCNRLSDHLESLAPEQPDGETQPPERPRWPMPEGKHHGPGRGDFPPPRHGPHGGPHGDPGRRPEPEQPEEQGGAPRRPKFPPDTRFRC